MIFFAVVAIVSVLTVIASRLGVPGFADWRTCMRVGLSFGLIFTGFDHVLVPTRYILMMPGFVSYPGEAVLFTGLCEIGGAPGLLMPPLRRVAGVVLAIYFLCVFPANITNAIEGLTVAGLPGTEFYYWLRLPLQPLVVWWSLFASEVVDWPFHRKRALSAASSPATNDLW